MRILLPLSVAFSALTIAHAQTTNFTLRQASSLYVTSSGSVRMPFKFHEISGPEVSRLRTDPVLNQFFGAISSYVETQGYNMPCSSRDLFMFKGSTATLKAMQAQWMATLKKSPNFYSEVNRSLGDKAQDTGGHPITIDTYLMKGRDDKNQLRSYTFITYPHRQSTWLLTCLSLKI